MRTFFTPEWRVVPYCFPSTRTLYPDTRISWFDCGQTQLTCTNKWPKIIIQSHSKLISTCQILRFWSRRDLQHSYLDDLPGSHCLMILTGVMIERCETVVQHVLYMREVFRHFTYDLILVRDSKIVQHVSVVQEIQQSGWEEKVCIFTDPVPQVPHPIRPGQGVVSPQLPVSCHQAWLRSYPCQVQGGYPSQVPPWGVRPAEGVPHLRYLTPSDLAGGMPRGVLNLRYPTPSDLAGGVPLPGGYPTSGNRWPGLDTSRSGMPLAFTARRTFCEKEYWGGTPNL